MAKRERSDEVERVHPCPSGCRRISEYKLRTLIVCDIHQALSAWMGLEPGTRVAAEDRSLAINTFVEHTADPVVVAAHDELMRNDHELYGDWIEDNLMGMLAIAIAQHVETAKARLSKYSPGIVWKEPYSNMIITEFDNDMGWGIVRDMTQMRRSGITRCPEYADILDSE